MELTKLAPASVKATLRVVRAKSGWPNTTESQSHILKVWESPKGGDSQ